MSEPGTWIRLLAQSVTVASTFEIYGEVAAQVDTNARGDYELILETRFGLEELTIPPTAEIGAEVGALSEGDRIVLEIEQT